MPRYNCLFCLKSISYASIAKLELHLEIAYMHFHFIALKKQLIKCSTFKTAERYSIHHPLAHVFIGMQGDFLTVNHSANFFVAQW
jgi:hypothetical protein